MLLKSNSLYRAFATQGVKPGHLRTQSSAVYIPNLKNKPKKKKPRKKHIRSGSSDFDLAPLKGKDIKKAPKIYENQIFIDFYDEKGNHDRIVELYPDSQLYSAEHHIPKDLLKLPSAGRNLNSAKKIVFY